MKSIFFIKNFLYFQVITKKQNNNYPLRLFLKFENQNRFFHLNQTRRIRNERIMGEDREQKVRANPGLPRRNESGPRQDSSGTDQLIVIN